jgi:hypothetical protein
MHLVLGEDDQEAAAASSATGPVATNNNYQRHAGDDADGDTALTFGLAVGQIVAKDDKGNKDSAMSVGNLLPSNGIQTACQTIVEDGASADGGCTTSSANQAAANYESSARAKKGRRGFGVMLADGISDGVGTHKTVIVNEASSHIEGTVLSSASSAAELAESFTGDTTIDSSSSGAGQDCPAMKTQSAAAAADTMKESVNEQKEKRGGRSSPRCLLLAGLATLIVGVVLGIVAGAGGLDKDRADATAMSSSTGNDASAPLTDSDKPTRDTNKKNGSNARTSPTVSPTTVSPTTIDQISDPNAYVPGHLTQMKFGVRLSHGLDIKVIANSKRTVKYINGRSSDRLFHERPDFGATFTVPKTAAVNVGGWVYLSNSEMDKVTKNGRVTSSGGVGRITFNPNGEVIRYDMILEKTDRNCGGGTTPWNTFVSCEESQKSPPEGHCYQVDPFKRVLQEKSDTRTVLGGSDGGSLESFAYDVRNKKSPRFFVTEDQADGALRRFTPAAVDWDNPSRMLHDEEGTLDYLFLIPSDEEGRNGTYQWTDNKSKAGKSAQQYYPNAEGIDVANGILYFVSKKDEDLFILDLDKGTYERKIVREEGIDVSPDQLVRLGGDDGIMYLTEDGGAEAGIHGRDAQGRYFTILESPIYKEETTGLAFSPNKKHMYLAYQKNGIVFDVWRKDGKKFDGGSLNVKYHPYM